MCYMYIPFSCGYVFALGCSLTFMFLFFSWFSFSLLSYPQSVVSRGSFTKKLLNKLPKKRLKDGLESLMGTALPLTRVPDPLSLSCIVFIPFILFLYISAFYSSCRGKVSVSLCLFFPPPLFSISTHKLYHVSFSLLSHSLFVSVVVFCLLIYFSTIILPHERCWGPRFFRFFRSP